MKHCYGVVIFTVLVHCAATAQLSLGPAVTYNLPQGSFGEFAQPAVGYEWSVRRHLKRAFVDVTPFYVNFKLKKTTFIYYYPTTPTQSDLTFVTLNDEWKFAGMTIGGGYHFLKKSSWGVYVGGGVCYFRGRRVVREYTPYGAYPVESVNGGSRGELGVVPRLGATVRWGRFFILPEVRCNFNFSAGFTDFQFYSKYRLGTRDPFLQIALGIHYTLIN